MTIPAGLLLGAVEVATAYVLYLVLARFDLVSSAGQPGWVSNRFDPLIMLVVVIVLTIVMRYAVQVLPSVAHSAFEARIRQVLARVSLSGPGEAGSFSVAEISHLVNNVVPKTGGFLQAFMSALGTTSLILLIAAELLHLSWKLTVLSVAGAAVFALPLIWIRWICTPFSDRAYAFHRAFTYRFLKDVKNVHFLKICGLNDFEAMEVSRIAKSVLANGRAYILLFAIGSNIPFLAGTTLIVGLLWLNATFALLPASELVPFVYLLNRVTGSFVVLSAVSGQVREYSPYVTELLRYADTLFPGEAPALLRGTSIQRLDALDVRNLVFGRHGPLTTPLSFSVRAGEMTLISGPSGRGKTTLLMTLLGLVPSLGGAIEWNQIPVGDIDTEELRRRIGFAGPEPYLIDADIRTNLLFGLNQSVPSDAEIDDASRIACAEFVHDLEGGLSYELRENGDGISAGQKQRLALARCILRRPDVLILDEATANLDENTERLFFERLAADRPGMMIIAVSHRSSLRAFATSFVEI